MNLHKLVKIGEMKWKPKFLKRIYRKWKTEKWRKVVIWKDLHCGVFFTFFYNPTVICTLTLTFVPDLPGELLGLHGAACLVVPIA